MLNKWQIHNQFRVPLTYLAIFYNSQVFTESWFIKPRLQPKYTQLLAGGYFLHVPNVTHNFVSNVGEV